MRTLLCVTGRPLAGKSWLARRFFRPDQIRSTGDAIRRAGLAHTLGGGDLGPEEVARDVAAAALRDPDTLCLDGFPRTPEQLALLENADRRVVVVAIEATLSETLAAARVLGFCESCQKPGGLGAPCEICGRECARPIPTRLMVARYMNTFCLRRDILDDGVLWFSVQDVWSGRAETLAARSLGLAAHGAAGSALLVRRVEAGREFLLPTRTQLDDAGFDLYAAGTTLIGPGETAEIDHNLAVAFPAGHFGLIHGRSSALRRGLIVRTSVIDHGFRGRLFTVARNESDEPAVVTGGERISQLVLLRYGSATGAVEVETLPESHRGTRGLGSSGR